MNTLAGAKGISVTSTLVRPLLLVVGLCLPLAHADRIKTFVPEKPYEVSIDLKDFEPFPAPEAEAILGGNAENDIIITIIAEEEEPGITPASARAKYAAPKGAGIDEATIQTANTGEMSVVFDPEGGPGPLTKVNGYAVKGDLSFDVHLSVDLAKHSKESVVRILETFQVIGSTEPTDMMSLAEKLGSGQDLANDQAPLKAFLTKYPQNSWGYAMLAELLFQLEKRDEAKQAYLQTLKNHKTQPLANPMALWKCYDGLGMCYGMSGDYEAAKRYFELGYKLAKDLEVNPLIAASAYNLACWYAETKDAAKSVEYLKNAIELEPSKKADAKEDSSFKNIREDKAFRELVGP